MPYINWKTLKAQVSLRDILDHYGLLDTLEVAQRNKEGEVVSYEGECPFCGSHAFKVNTEKNAWFCFGTCKAKAKESKGQNGGNILDFVARMEDVSVKQSAELIVEWFLEYPAPTNTGKSPAVPRSQSKDANRDVATSEPKSEPKNNLVREPKEYADSSKPKETVPEPAQSKDTLDAEGQGRETPVVTYPEENLLGRSNSSLPFTLKSIDIDHLTLHRLGFERETLAHFGVGYFTGKGMMHEKVVIPFYDKESRLVAYVGYSVEDGSFTYPETFDRRLDLYNYPLCEFGLGLDHSGVVLVTDILNVFRLYELGVRHVLALPSEEIHAPQLDLVESLVGLGGGVEFVPWTKHYSENLQRLSERFHTRLHRYYLGSEDEFIAQVAQTLDW